MANLSQLETENLNPWHDFSHNANEVVGTDLPNWDSWVFNELHQLQERMIGIDLQKTLDCFDPFVLDGCTDVGMIGPGTSSSASTPSWHDGTGIGIHNNALVPSVNEHRSTSDSDYSIPEMMIDIPGERRRAQNRAAQRAHRERQKRYVGQLEKRYFALQNKHHQLDENFRNLLREYESLINVIRRLKPPDTSTALKTSGDMLSTSTTGTSGSRDHLSTEQEAESGLPCRPEPVRLSPQRQSSRRRVTGRAPGDHSRRGY